VNYKITLMVAAIAAGAAAFIVLGSAFPIVQSTFAQDGDTNTADTCTGEVGNNADCRQQGCQLGSGNTQTNTFKDGDMNTADTNTTDTCTGEAGNNADCKQEECQLGSGNKQTNTFD
jgi:hypothetical protein